MVAKVRPLSCDSQMENSDTTVQLLICMTGPLSLR